MAKVLLIDDEAPILTMYSESIRQAGFDLIIARTGDEGINLAKKEHPNLILLDIIMPKVNGLDALTQIKSDSDLKDIPVYLLTNLPESASGNKPSELGADGYLVKASVEPDELVKIIKKALEK